METCVLCESRAVINRQEGASRTIYNCPKCGMYVVSDLVEKEVKNKSDEIGAYLISRKLSKNDAETVLISFEKANLDKDYLQLTVDQIVSFAPKTFSEQMNIALRNLGYMSEYPGHEVKISDIQTALAFYVKGKNPDAFLYLMQSMRKSELVDFKHYEGSVFPFNVMISPKGWERLQNPQNDEKMRKSIFAYAMGDNGNPNVKLFYAALEKISKECGYSLSSAAKVLADSKVTFELVSEVKSGGLIVCDFTEQSSGCYYAAAMAQSLGKNCILTCHESARKKMQFNTDQYRVIFWDKQDALYLELLSTIKALF